MSEFSDNLALAFDTSVRVFGESCTIAEHVYDCVVHAIDGSEGVKSGNYAGRQQDVTGSLILRKADWTDIKARLQVLGKKTKGVHVTLASGEFRVLNDPDISFVNDTVELQIGPLI